MENAKTKTDANHSKIFWASLSATTVGFGVALSQVEVPQDLSDTILKCIEVVTMGIVGIEANFQMVKSNFHPEDYIIARQDNYLGASIGVVLALYGSMIYEYHSYLF